MKIDLLKLTPREFCAATGACSEGAKFALKHRTMKTVWDKCQRVDWLCWILDAIDAPCDESVNRKFMIWCARNTPLLDGRTTFDLLTEIDIRHALLVAESFSDGRATPEQLSTARSTAWYAAPSVARSAAWSVAESAAPSAAWSAAELVARYAARSAAESVAESAAESVAESVAWSAQAAQFKRIIKNPFA